MPAVGALLFLLFFIFAYMGAASLLGGTDQMLRAHCHGQAAASSQCKSLLDIHPCSPPPSLVTGVLLFGQVAWQEDLNAHANFTTFPDALLLLFRVATGDNWAALLKDCMVQPPECNAGAGNCGHDWAPVYFLSFYLSGAMIALNLLTTVILGGWAGWQVGVLGNQHFLQTTT